MEMWLENSRKGRELLKCADRIFLGSWGDGAVAKVHKREDLSSDPNTLLKARHVVISGLAGRNRQIPRAYLIAC